MPDGTQCEPNKKFNKTWLIKNTGKLEWNESFPVKLVCIAGNIITADGSEYVDVAATKLNETSSISVELVAPSVSGNYFSEWVLSCNNFQFGPRIWCSIEVVDAENPAEDSPQQTQQEQPKNGLIIDLDNIKMNNSCFKPSNSYKPLNMSAFEALLSPNDQSRHDDTDDEFVVVPDCFDLSKKWKPPTTSDIEMELNKLKKSMLENSHENSYVNIKDRENESFDESIFRIKTPNGSETPSCSLTLNEDLIMLNSTESSDKRNEQVVIEMENSTQDAVKDEPKEEDATTIIGDNSDANAMPLIALLPANKM